MLLPGEGVNTVERYIINEAAAAKMAARNPGHHLVLDSTQLQEQFGIKTNNNWLRQEPEDDCPQTEAIICISGDLNFYIVVDREAANLQYNPKQYSAVWTPVVEKVNADIKQWAAKQTNGAEPFTLMYSLETDKDGVKVVTVGDSRISADDFIKLLDLYPVDQVLTFTEAAVAVPGSLPTEELITPVTPIGRSVNEMLLILGSVGCLTGGGGLALMVLGGLTDRLKDNGASVERGPEQVTQLEAKPVQTEKRNQSLNCYEPRRIKNEEKTRPVSFIVNGGCMDDVLHGDRFITEENAIHTKAPEVGDMGAVIVKEEDDKAWMRLAIFGGEEETTGRGLILTSNQGHGHRRIEGIDMTVNEGGRVGEMLVVGKISMNDLKQLKENIITADSGVNEPLKRKP